MGRTDIRDKVCPDCGRPPGGEHTPRCPRIQRNTTNRRRD